MIVTSPKNGKNTPARNNKVTFLTFFSTIRLQRTMSRNNVQLAVDTTSLPRMVTRPKNATTHPGAILQDAQRVRRSKDEIEEEKEVKRNELRAKLEKMATEKAKKAKGEAYLAQLDAVEDVAIANAHSEFPRQKLKNGVQ